MIGSIIVAIACNLIVALILVSGIFNALHNGVRINLIKLFMTLCGGVSAYFLTPVISNKFYGIEGMRTVLEGKISNFTINSCIFLFWFLIFYVFTLIICRIIRYCIIKKLGDKKLNKLKMKRAKSINPSAERAARVAEYRSLKAKYLENRKWYHKVISFLIGTVIAVTVGYLVLMPFNYIFKDMERDYLVKGYKYTLNGVIGEKVPEFLLNVENVVDNNDDGTEVEEEIAPGIEISPAVPNDGEEAESEN